MAGVFLILFICCLFFPCQGLITSPPHESNQTVLPGSTVTIIWSFNDALSEVSFREWRFTSTDGSFISKTLASITFDQEPKIEDNGLTGVSIIKPATLLLKNVNESHNGRYQFRLSGLKNDDSDVVVYISRKPSVTINCSSLTILDKGDDLVCLCKGENGSPPADVAWYDKNGNVIGQKEKENKTLVLRNVTEADSGTYTCKAQSYTFINETPIEVKVNYKPNDVNITITNNPATIGGKTKISCSSNGYPEPNVNITHNDTNTVSTKKVHAISEVTLNDAGKYTCIAWNKFGNATASKDLSVKGQTPTSSTPPSTTSSNGTGTGVTDGGNGDKLSVGAIVGIVIGVLVLGVIIVGLVYYCKTKERNGYKGNANVKPGDNGSEDAAENTYDTASGPSGSRTKPSKGDAPVVYSAVDKENRQGRPLYATLDEAAMRAPNNRKTPEEERPEPTQYASIEFGKTEEVPKADLV